MDEREAERWPSVKGKILHSDVTRGCKHDYQIFTKYVFEVEGHIYHGQRLSFGPAGCLSEAAANLVQARYPTGPTKIHYEKNAPQNAVLLTGEFLPEAMPGVRLCIALAIIPLLIAVVLLVSSRRSL